MAKTSLVHVRLTFDATLGFPGEGPPKQIPSVKTFFTTLDPDQVKRDRKFAHEAELERQLKREIAAKEAAAATERLRVAAQAAAAATEAASAVASPDEHMSDDDAHSASPDQSELDDPADP